MQNILLLILFTLAQASHARVTLSSSKSIQGSILSVSSCSPSVTGLSLKWNKIETKFFQNPVRKQCQIAFFAIPYDAPLGPQTLLIREKKIGFEIIEKQFAFENLSVEPDKIKLSEKDQERFEQEWKFVQAIYAEPESDLLWKHQFQIPLNSRSTSPYGMKRLFNGEVKKYHNGVDLKAAVGTPIRASNDGRVRLARDFLLAGNLILIEHGGGIFTNYAHLSSFEVKEGDLVKKGQVIAHSGATGRVNGPHLHWGLRIHGAEADPLSLLKLKLKYK